MGITAGCSGGAALTSPIVRGVSPACESAGLDLGFMQAQEKPWLFFLRVPGAGMVYASMGGGLDPIWEDSRARMWGKGEPEVVEEVRLHARRRGVRFLVTS